MLRVLHCIYDDPGNPWVAGGGSVRVYEIYRRLADRLRSITVATGTFPGAREEEIEGVGYKRLGFATPYALSRLSYSYAASRLLSSGAYDVAVYDFSTYTPLRIPGNRAIGITVHHLTGETALSRWGPVLGRMVVGQEIRRLRRGRFFSATSRATEGRLRALLGPEAEIHLIQAGVPDELFVQPRREADYLLYFGRLDWVHKGLDVLLRAMAAVIRTDPDVRLKVAGRGKDADRVLEAAQELGIRDNVELVGAVDDGTRAELLAGAQAMLMPSRFEGFGMAAAEAMAAGVPLIASRAGSLPEVVDPPEGGVLVPVGDSDALARATIELLHDDTRRRELSRTARLSAERFRWDRVAEQHLHFLHAIYSAAGSTSGRGR
ncbi:MAG: glycosyltransferase [Gemmatimonas sp.]|nr:glycosyltransferase [Gemmatimonas sp.]